MYVKQVCFDDYFDWEWGVCIFMGTDENTCIHAIWVGIFVHKISVSAIQRCYNVHEQLIYMYMYLSRKFFIFLQGQNRSILEWFKQPHVSNHSDSTET